MVLAVFAFVMLATALGALHPSSARPAKAVGEVVWSGLPVLGLGVVVMALARVTPFRGLLVPGLIIAVVGFVSLVIDVLARRDSGARVMLERADIEAQPDAAPQPPPQPQRATARRHVAAALAVAPLAAFGVAAVRGSAGDVALIGAGPGGRVAGRLIAGCVLTIAAGALVLPVNALGKRLVRLDDRTRLVILGLLVAVHAPGMLMHDPDVNVAHAHQVGALALLMVFLSGFALLPTAAAWLAYLLMRFTYSRPFAVPSAVRILRFQSTPVLGLLTLWALLAGVVPYRSYHDMRRVAAAGDAPSTPPPSLDSIVSGWFAAPGRHGGGPRAVRRLVGRRYPCRLLDGGGARLHRRARRPIDRPVRPTCRSRRGGGAAAGVDDDVGHLGWQPRARHLRDGRRRRSGAPTMPAWRRSTPAGTTSASATTTSRRTSRPGCSTTASTRCCDRATASTAPP